MKFKNKYEEEMFYSISLTMGEYFLKLIELLPKEINLKQLAESSFLFTRFVDHIYDETKKENKIND